ncbi:MAG: hypothetical protein M3P27_10740 [Acidobacteriota bacterium]|nr:hypothetical protein [Acidobacteriota bacterium]
MLRLAIPTAARAGEATTTPGGYRVLAPITHGNLTIFPVVGASTHDTHDLITLDEGLRSGEVIVTEAGQVQPLMRRRGTPQRYRYSGDGAQVNQLVLVNNSKRPLLLLAGEIVTGGKQDRVIGKDRIIPAESDPIDLGVFCVEPGRWVAQSDRFSGLSAQMAQPSVRKKAMAEKDQQKVWAEVGKSRQAAADAVASASPSVSAGSGAGVGGGVMASQVREMSSYARVMDNKAVKAQVDSVAGPMERSYDAVIRQLKDQNAVGVVVAINGEIEWVDVFASTDLLQRYWRKLVRSYAAETIGVRPAKYGQLGTKEAQAFLEDWSGKRQTVETEPGLYRHVEVVGRGFRAFQLTSLLPKTGFDLHLSKMAEEQLIGD